MSSNSPIKQSQKAPATKYEVIELTSSPITNLVSTMQKVKTDSKDAKLNATSISDGKGGRIELNEEKDNLGSVVIRGVEDRSNSVKGVK